MSNCERLTCSCVGRWYGWWKPTPPSVPQTPIQVPVPCAKSVTLAEPPLPRALNGQVEGSKGAAGTGEVLVPCLGDVGAEALFWRECCRYWEAAGEAGRSGLLELSQQNRKEKRFPLFIMAVLLGFAYKPG